MAAKLVEALRIFTEHFGLFACLVLTLWLPANLVINALDYLVYAEDDFVSGLRLVLLLDGTIGAIPLAAILMTLAKLKRNEDVSYASAMFDGLSRFIRVIVVNICVGIVLGGLAFASFLLVMTSLNPVEPGSLSISSASLPQLILGIIMGAAALYLLVRFALVNIAVVIQNLGPIAGMRESYLATKGILFPIVVFGALSYPIIFAVGFIFNLPLLVVEVVQWGEFPLWPQILYSTLVNCITDILMVLPTIIFFLYYWERRWGEAERNPAESPALEQDHTNNGVLLSTDSQEGRFP